MNTAFNSALKLSTSIRKDLAALSTATNDAPNGSPLAPNNSAALGSLTASLTAFARTLDEYSTLANQELDPTKQEKARSRLGGFQTELADYRAQLDTIKTTRDTIAHNQNRNELLGRRPYTTSTPENPYANATTSGSTSYGGYGHARTTTSSGGLGMGSSSVTAEEHVLREQNSLSNASATLDEYISHGQAVLNNLEIQKGNLKNVQKRVYSVANTLGLSGNTIRMVERRAREDKWIFWAGVLLFFGFCWLCLHFLR